MRDTLRKATAILAGTFLFNAWSNAEDSICAEPLKAALMTIRVQTSGGSATSAETAWYCSSSFSSHNDALSAGLNVGTVVYGVPLKVNGSFDQTKVSEWKKDNCSSRTMNTDYRQATYNYLREVAPGAMSAYASCISAYQNNSPLSCELSKDTGALSVKWRKMAGESDSAAPIVQNVMITNGTCTPGISIGTAVKEGGDGSPCTPEKRKDFLVMVQTSRGMCSAVHQFERSVLTIPQVLSLDGDRTFNSDIVRFEPNSIIITNGHFLNINSEKVSINGSAQIVTIDKSKAILQPGSNGTSGGSLVIAASEISGGILRIDLSGQNGAAGRNGANGTPGVAGSNASPRGWQAWGQGCGGGSPSTPGGQGTAGQAGSDGGIGGNGGLVVVKLSGENSDQSLSSLDIVSVDGSSPAGVGGMGGIGGEGGPGGPGGSGSGGNQGCGGRPGSDSGPPGPTGPAGLKGKDGQPGAISVTAS